MSLITLTSDYGNSSHYIAAIKGNLLKHIPGVNIVDITHEIRTFDILQAAFMVRNTYPSFPDNTIHIICIDTNINLHKQFLLVEESKQYFIVPDNGIVNLLFDTLPQKIFSIDEQHLQEVDLFPEKNLFISVAKKIIEATPIETFAKPAAIKNRSQLQQPVLEENIIRATVVYVDSYQNAFVNVTKEKFIDFGKGRKFKIYYHRKEHIAKISSHYNEVREGDELALFNENGYLEIAQNKGQASQLLGLKVESKIIIEFFD